MRRTLDIVSDGRTCMQENMKLAWRTPAPITASNTGVSLAHLRKSKGDEIHYL